MYWPIAFLEGQGVSSTALLFVGVFLATYWAVRSQSDHKNKRPPCLWSVPIIGSAPFIPELKKLPAFFTETAQRLGPIFSFYAGSEHIVVLNGREAIREALVEHSYVFADRKPPYTLKKYWNPKQLGVISKPYNSDFRKYHQLTLSILKEFGFGQSSMEQRILTEAEALTGRIMNLNGAKFDPTEFLNVCTVNIIISIVFGERIEQSEKKIRDLTQGIHKFINHARRQVDLLPARRFLPRYKAIINDASKIKSFLVAEVEEWFDRSLLNDENSFIKSFIEREGEQFDRAELKYIIYDLLVAGSETTATTIHWALVILANHQDIQKKLQEEVDSVIPKERFPSLDDMSKLPYVEAAMLELYRLKAVVPLSLRRATLAKVQVGEYFIPAKTEILVNLRSVHMDPATWSNPEEYRPERFLNESGQVFGRDRVMPFSLGKRSCLGELLARQEVFLLFTTLIQRFNMLPAEGQEKIICTEEFGVTMCPSFFEMRCIPRQN